MRSVLEKHASLSTQLCLSPALLGMHRGTSLAPARCGASVPAGPSLPPIWLLTALGTLGRKKAVSAGLDGQFAAHWSPWQKSY